MKQLRILFGVVLVLSMVLAACAPQTIIETVEVEKVVEVEKEVVVEKEVEVEVEVEKVVEVTAAPDAPKMFDGREINFMAGQPHQVAGRQLAEWFTEETGARVNVLVSLPEHDRKRG